MSDEKRVLVIDDMRTFRFPATYARDCVEALKHLFPPCEWDEVWFDHDLGQNYGEDTIYPVIHHLEEMAFYGQVLPIGVAIIHTANPVGRTMIDRALSRLYTVRHVDATEYIRGFDPSAPNPGTVLGRLVRERREQNDGE